MVRSKVSPFFTYGRDSKLSRSQLSSVVGSMTSPTPLPARPPATAPTPHRPRADRPRDRADRQAAGGPADGGADAGLDRMRARLVGDGSALRRPLGGRSADFSGSFLVAMSRTPETALLSPSARRRPRPAARVASVPGTSASRLPTAPHDAQKRRFSPIHGRMSEIPPGAKPLAAFAQRVGPGMEPRGFEDPPGRARE